MNPADWITKHRYWFFPVLFAFLIACAGIQSEFGKKQPYVMDWTGAALTAQVYVKQNLKSPATAKFKFIEQEDVTRVDQNRWRVSSYVDSQNSFGAMLRTHYTVVVRYEPEKGAYVDDANYY